MSELTKMVKIGAIEYSAQNEVADELTTLREKLAKRDARIAELDSEATEYWAFISAVAKYFDAKDGEDMRDIIVKGMDKLKAEAMRGEALARTVMADQASYDKAINSAEVPK
jgi:hypothetical protein